MATFVRLIPQLLVRADGLAVKGRHFMSHKPIGDAAALVKTYAQQHADEIQVLFLEEPRKGIIDNIQLSCEDTPLAMGGNVSPWSVMQGCEKFIFGPRSLAFYSEHLCRFTRQYGQQAAVGCVNYNIVPDDLDFVARECGEVVLQNRTRDGDMKGYDTGVFDWFVTRSVPVPIVLSCGAGNMQHVADALAAGATAVAFGSLLAHTDTNLPRLRAYLRARGHNVRPL